MVAPLALRHSNVSRSMKSKSKSPIWPYLAVLASLFVLSVSAPRAWQRMARRPAGTKPAQADQIVSPSYDGPSSANFEHAEPEEYQSRSPITIRIASRNPMVSISRSSNDSQPLGSQSDE